MSLTLIATLFPLACWLAYSYGVPLVEKRYPSLSVIMSMQRRRWVANAVGRDNPMDAILSATGDAGRCMKNTSGLGTIKQGSPADFVIYRDDPTKDIRATRTIESVWIAGAKMP